MSLDDLPPLREVVARHGLAPKKALGQNFLFDLNLTRRIACAGRPLDGAPVMEVGPGPGGLTRALLAEGAGRVVAVERDDRALPALAEIAERYPGRLDILAEDAMEVDPAQVLGAAEDARIVANLPYNVGTRLLTDWLSPLAWPPVWSEMVLMFQREVAERIVAEPGTDAYGRLSVLAGWRAHARIAFDVPPSAFVPAPKVTSSVVVLTPRLEPIACDPEALETVTRAAFGQRRKMLRQSLKPLGGEALLERVGIDPTRRAETLSVEEFCALANAAQASGGSSSSRRSRTNS